MDEPISRPTRRQVVGTMGAGAALVWAAPTILSIDAARAATAAPLNLTAVAGFDGDFIVVTDDGRAFWSPDAGITWTSTADDGMAGLDFVAVTADATVDSVTVTAITASGVVWYTLDAGVTWSAATSPPTISGVVAAAGVDAIVVVVNAGGDAWFSNDSGDTWTIAAVTLPGPVTGLCATDDVDGARFDAVSSLGTVMSSHDGTNWTTVPAAPSAPAFVSVASSGDDFCAVAGTSTVYHRSPVLGWTPVPTATDGLTIIASDGVGDLVAVGTAGAVNRGTASGTVWDNDVSGPPAFAMTSVAGDRFGHFVGIGAGGLVSCSNLGDVWQSPTTSPS